MTGNIMDMPMSAEEKAVETSLVAFNIVSIVNNAPLCFVSNKSQKYLFDMFASTHTYHKKLSQNNYFYWKISARKHK